MLGSDDELVVARLGGKDRAFPANGEPVPDGLGVIRQIDAEVEPDRRVNPIDDPVFFPPEPLRLEVPAVQPLGTVPLARSAEGANKIGDGVLILADCQPR